MLLLAKGYTPWVYDSFLALYCSVQVVASEAATERGSSLLGGLYALLHLVDRALISTLRLQYGFFGSHRFGLFWGSIFLFALVILAVLRVLARFRSIENLLLTLGLIVVIAAPLSWRRVIYAAPFTPSIPIAWWQWPEVTVAATCVLYLKSRKPRVGFVAALIVLLVHFGFWYFIFFARNDWWELMAAATIVLPLCASIAWVTHVWLSSANSRPGIHRA